MFVCNSRSVCTAYVIALCHILSAQTGYAEIYKLRGRKESQSKRSEQDFEKTFNSHEPIFYAQ